jgi:hypothetical protein
MCVADIQLPKVNVFMDSNGNMTPQLDASMTEM